MFISTVYCAVCSHWQQPECVAVGCMCTQLLDVCTTTASLEHSRTGTVARHFSCTLAQCRHQQPLLIEAGVMACAEATFLVEAASQDLQGVGRCIHHLLLHLPAPLWPNCRPVAAHFLHHTPAQRLMLAVAGHVSNIVHESVLRCKSASTS